MANDAATEAQLVLCAKRAQTEGALTYVPGIGCCPVFGKIIPIGPDEADIQVGFQITNFNFHVSGDKPALQNQNQLPGPALPKDNLNI